MSDDWRITVSSKPGGTRFSTGFTRVIRELDPL
jgi:hypothetical protein